MPSPMKCLPPIDLNAGEIHQALVSRDWNSAQKGADHVKRKGAHQLGQKDLGHPRVVLLATYEKVDSVHDHPRRKGIKYRKLRKLAEAKQERKVKCTMSSQPAVM